MQKAFRQLIFVALFVLIGCASVGRAATFQQVNNALKLAKAFVYSKQVNGLWEKVPAPPDEAECDRDRNNVVAGQWGGDTALAVYALLAAGESPDDPRLAKAIHFLETADIRGVYALGLRSQLFNFLRPSDDLRSLAAHDVQLYESSISVSTNTFGMFDYRTGPNISTRNDHSVSQYGVLGAWACERAGVEVPTRFWEVVENGWNRDQSPTDGSWHYTDEGENTRKPTATMTLAGIATLFITEDYLHVDDGLSCGGNVNNPHIDAGMKWLSQNLDHIFTDSSNDAPYYGLYGLERVGVASGRRYIGNKDWFQFGADWLIDHQDTKAGDWIGELEQTCFAILFLSRGSAPVVFNKLQYDVAGKEGDWNERPRDIANLTKWIAAQTEQDLNWQIVDFHAPISDLLDAPILYLSGDKALALSDSDAAKLREYCEDGGLIVANADCANEAFAKSFRKLGTKLFPYYEFHVLSASSPIFTNQQFLKKKWLSSPNVLTLDNSVREMMVMAPTADTSRHWQLNATERYPVDFELGDDILLYAIDKNNYRRKGESFFVQANPAVATTRTINIARLQYEGNWDPEPGGWRRLTAILRNDFHTELDTTVAKLGTGDLAASESAGTKVAALTGTNSLRLSPAARKDLQDFVQGGGTLIVDSAGGSSDFATSIEKELTTMFGPDAANQMMKTLPADAPVFHVSGNVISDFKFRRFARKRMGPLNGPQLAAISVKNRPAIFYSRLDITGGLVGQSTDGIVGYDPATATALMVNMILLGSGHANG
jgi:hypothetical protein